jgi:hypothetical protein
MSSDDNDGQLRGEAFMEELDRRISGLTPEECWTLRRTTPEPKKALSRPIGCMKMRPQTDE